MMWPDKCRTQKGEQATPENTPDFSVETLENPLVKRRKSPSVDFQWINEPPRHERGIDAKLGILGSKWAPSAIPIIHIDAEIHWRIPWIIPW